MSKLLLWPWLLILITSIAKAQNSNPDPFDGTFSGSGLTITLIEQNGSYTGAAVFEGQNLSVSAQKISNVMISGSYTFQGQQLPFQAQVSGDMLTLVAGGETYALSRQKDASSATVPPAVRSESSVASPSNRTKMALSAGEVGDPYLGFKFKSPAGWTAKQAQAGYLLGSQTQKGFVVILPHQYGSLDELRTAAREGLVDEEGTMLQLNGELKPFGQTGVVAEFTGTVEWQKAHARAIGLLSPYGGGVTILIAVEEASYSQEYQYLVESIAKSMQFFKAETPPITEEWQQLLSGARLTYLWSYYSGGMDGAYAGGSQTTKIDLCSQGYFRYSDSNQMAVDGGFGSGYNASGYSGGADQGQGQWEVAARGQTPLLRLKFHDGRVLEYVLSMPDGKTYLDDKRYFRTYSNDSQPDQRPQCW